ncbi:MAG: outer membrane beta-barrel family protein, partial [Sphingobacteriaceae bacterium]|nr:outer membrane beta-barrel family protein [Sphingobacteriaceae bacterium]
VFDDFANVSRLITDPKDVNYGKIESSFVNVKGNYSGRFFTSIGQPIIKGNKLALNIGGGASYSKNTAFINATENINNSLGLSGNFKLTSSMDKLDMIVGVNGRMDKSEFSANKSSNTQYYTLTPNVDVSYLLPGKIRIQTDIFYNQITGRGAGFDTNFTLMNGYVSRQFFDNKGTFKFSVNDILNQNTGVTRTSTGTTIQDSNFNVLKRYYMLSFTYSLSKQPAKQNNMMMMGGHRG